MYPQAPKVQTTMMLQKKKKKYGKLRNMKKERLRNTFNLTLKLCKFNTQKN